MKTLRKDSVLVQNWKEDSIKKSKRGSFLQPKQTSRELSSRLLWLWKTVEKTCSNLSNYSWWIIAATTYCSASSLEFAAIFCKNPLSLYFNPRIKLVKWVASVSALLPNTSTKTKVLSTETILVVFISVEQYSIYLCAMEDGGVHRTVIDCGRPSWAKWQTFILF